MSSALSTGMFLGSPVPMKKWHLSAQAPQRTQMSMKSLNDRYFSSRSAIPFRRISFQSAGSFQSASMGLQSRGFGKLRISRLFGFAPWQNMPSLIATGVSIHSVFGGAKSIFDSSSGFGSFAMITPFLPAGRLFSFCP